MSNSKWMRFNIFMNFDREFSTHWLNKAPLFATLSLAPKICTHLGFLQPLPLWPAKWLNQSQGREWGWGLCSLPALSWQTSVWDEEMLSHSSRERNWGPPQCQGTPSFCDRAVHTQLFYHVSVCILGRCVTLGLQSPVQWQICSFLPVCYVCAISEKYYIFHKILQISIILY